MAWTPSCEIAFQKLKEQLCSAPVLRSPDFEKMFTVQTDASDRGVGAVLSQADGEGGDHPIAFYSRKLLPREERYATVEKECLAVKLGVEAFRVYLLGRPFVVETDEGEQYATHTLEFVSPTIQLHCSLSSREEQW